jgi:hypothetical protein
MNKQMITRGQYEYLRSQGAKNNVKVCYVVRDLFPYIHIHNHEFDNFAMALRYLQQDSLNVIQMEAVA